MKNLLLGLLFLFLCLLSGITFAGKTAYLVDTYRYDGKRVCLYETSQGEVFELVKQGEAGSCPRTHFFE
ncbi:hypothetical protein BAU67_001809 [Escherichia coli]|nr:hypothetical protein [Escherichia coli]EMB7054253.1 hypothetical protein [Escherichia coli]